MYFEVAQYNTLILNLSLALPCLNLNLTLLAVILSLFLSSKATLMLPQTSLLTYLNQLPQPSFLLVYLVEIVNGQLIKCGWEDELYLGNLTPTLPLT